MRIAISGTHFIGKSTLIQDFLNIHPDYTFESEPYYKLQDEQLIELSLEPSLESLLQQLDLSIQQTNQHKDEKNIIFDRCPIDFVAYAMCIAEAENFDINDSEVAERFSDIKAALNNLDLIVFAPLSKENQITYTEENPEYRKLADKFFKKIYRDDIIDIFPGYNHPRIIEVTGDRKTRVKVLESYLTQP